MTLKGSFAEGYAASLKQRDSGRALHYYDSLVSTNLVAKELFAASGKADFVVAAKVQTGGFGKYGRRWESPEGGLWFSFIARADNSVVPLFTLAAGHYVAEYFLKKHNIRLQVKWPNDLVYNGRKVCGILTELLKAEKGYSYLLCGIGINLNNTGFQFPAQLRGIVTSIAQISGQEYDPAETLAEILHALDAAPAGIVPGELINNLNSLSYSSDRKVLIRCGDIRLEGVFRRITPEGAALVEAGGKEYKTTGDIEYL